MKRIDIIVQPDGTSRVETHGFQGASCREASRFLEQALGQVFHERPTAEFHQSAVTSQEARQQT